MHDEHVRPHWDDLGLVMVVGAVLLAPLAWFIDLEVSYATVKWACTHHRRGLLLLFPVGSLSLIAAAAWMSWSSLTKLRGARADGGTVEDRSYLLAVTGLGLCALFGLLIVSSLVPRLLLSPCQ